MLAMQLGLEELERAIGKGEAEAEKRDLRKDNAAGGGRAAVPCRHFSLGLR